MGSVIRDLREEIGLHRDLFGLSDEQFARISPHLPSDTRGKPRVDDRRVISGIVRGLKSGGRWVDASADYGPRDALHPIRPMGREGRLGAHLPCTVVGGRRTGSRPDRLLRREGTSLRVGWKRGEKAQPVGRSRGGRTTRIHAQTDTLRRPIAFLLTGGQVADCTAASVLLERLPTCPIPHADKGCDTNHIRRIVEAEGTMPNIPPKVNRKNCVSPYLCRDRNAIERMFRRLKDFCRIATPYDRLAVNFLAAVHIAATVAYRLRVLAPIQSADPIDGNSVMTRWASGSVTGGRAPPIGT